MAMHQGTQPLPQCYLSASAPTGSDAVVDVEMTAGVFLMPVHQMLQVMEQCTGQTLGAIRCPCEGLINESRKIGNDVPEN